MIFDHITKSDLYASIGPRLASAFAFLREALESIDSGETFTDKTVEIDGTDVYAMFQSFTTEPERGRFYESHRNYIDVQCVVEGVEIMRVRSTDGLAVTTHYSAEKDFALYGLAPGIDVRLGAGDFVVLFPHDAHLPKLPADQPAPVRKIVVKVRV